MALTNISTTFDFGKVDFNRRGRKINRITVEVRLYQKSSGLVFSACGNIWNGRGTDVIVCGQCLDTISKYVKSPVFNKLYDFWKKYHNNDMHPGTEEQESYLESKGIVLHNMDRAIEALKKAGMEKDSDGIVYGHKWYYHPIPKKDLDDIKKFLIEEN